MPRKKLTALAVAHARSPEAGRLELWDTVAPGLGLRITDRGVKSWCVLTRVGGKLRRFTLGRYPTLDLVGARAKARQILASIEAGEPPERKDTVAAVVADFIERHAKPRNRGWQEAERILNRELAAWADRPLAKITRRDVIEVLDRTADRAPILANRLRGQLQTMFKWAIGRGIVSASPVVGVPPPVNEASRDRVLLPAELAAVWRACEGLGWPYGPIVRLLILTAQRRGEVANMRWRDIGHNEALWTLPREQTKANRIHDVPLSASALAILAELPRFVGNELVFPARAGKGPVSDWSAMKRRLDKLSRVTGWRLHDLRRTAADGMARAGVPLHVVSAILNHSPGRVMGVTSVYVRYRFSDERRLALDAWAAEIERLAAPS